MNWSAVTWEVARAGGIVSFLLVTASVVVGLLVSLRAASPRFPRFLTSEVHGFLGLLSLVFVAVHVLAVWVDPFTHFGLADVLVPFVSHYRTFWMSLGIVGFYLLLAIWITTRLRERIGHARWRRVHALTFALWAAGLVHGLGTGSDTRTAWAALLYLGSAVAVLALSAVRLRRSASARASGPGFAALSVGAVLVVAWAIAGPFQRGWGRSTTFRAAAATASRPGSRSVDASASRRAARPSDPFRAGFSAPISGRLRQSGPDGRGNVTVRIGTTIGSGPGGMLEVVLLGEPLPGGGVRISASRVLLGPGPSAPLYQGQLAALDGQDMIALVSRHGTGRSLRLHIVLSRISDGHVQGLVSARPESA